MRGQNKEDHCYRFFRNNYLKGNIYKCIYLYILLDLAKVLKIIHILFD
jgi:hypothetical protein